MSVINQKEYLKKYLGIGKGSGEKKKKKKSKQHAAQQGKGLKIVDDDINVNLNEEIKVDLAADNEDAPQIVSVIDDRPPSLRIDEKTQSKLWKPLGAPEDEPTVSKNVVFNNSFKFKVKKERHKKNDKEHITSYSPRRNNLSGDDNSPPRIDNDISPPRKVKRERSEDFSPPRKGRNSNGDTAGVDSSPPRRIKREKSEDNSPPRRARLSERDKSSPRKRNKERSEDYSPPRRSRPPDMSPPRRIKKEKSEDNSPPRRSRPSEADILPPRKRNKEKSEDSSPSRRSRPLVLSPPRKIKRSEDILPPRRGRTKSPPNRSKNSESKANNSPTRKKKSRWADSDQDDQPKMQKTLDGKKAGLQNASDLAQETLALKKREDTLFKNLSAEVSGANAATVVRSKKKEVDWEAEEKRRKKEEENKEKYDRWGKGLKQVEDGNEKLQSDLHEMSKPLARYADDEDLEKYLKDKEREGDPMLAYIRQKKKKKDVDEGKPIKQKYQGDAPPNRFGIWPGYRWDGVDRSSGYEKEWFQVQNSKKASIEETYKWSTEDM